MERSGAKHFSAVDEVSSPYNINKLITNRILANDKRFMVGLRVLVVIALHFMNKYFRHQDTKTQR
jgi:hypothetical protein